MFYPAGGGHGLRNLQFLNLRLFVCPPEKAFRPFGRKTLVSNKIFFFLFFKGAVDRGMHYIYKHDLPRINKDIKPFLSTHKTATRLNDRSCDVIRMAINQHILALLGI